MISPDSDKRGFYLVGPNQIDVNKWKKFYNKTEALSFASKFNFGVKWMFNHSVYGNIDWTIPIEIPLKELYRMRAQQLRDKYDYIILHYSGGQDSNNMLHSFIDNNIRLDKIVIQVPEPERRHSNNTDFSSNNYWGEFDYQTLPYLKKLGSKLKGIEITVQDTSKTTIELLSDPYWTEKVLPNASYNLGVIARSMAQYTSKNILDIVDQGKTSCQLTGIDKPLVHFDGIKYKCFFVDHNAYHTEPIDTTLNDIFTKTVTEFFYWTPDLPEIVVKQAQEIKKACEKNTVVRELFTRTKQEELSIFRPVMQNIIYDPLHAPTFQTAKPSIGAEQVYVLHKWFYKGENQVIVKNYNNGLSNLSEKISNNFYINEDPILGYKSIQSPWYKL